MIIGVSIVDKHKPEGKRHVGTLVVEISYPGNSHFELLAVACPVENEHLMRPYVGRWLQVEDMLDPVRVDSMGDEF